MKYTVQKLAKLAGVSTRTLRYYDEIGLLKSARINSSGYRIYGELEVDQLQQILFYRELGVNLETIRGIIMDPEFDRVKALKDHHAQLIDKRQQLDLLLVNVEKTIANTEGRIAMSDKEKFEGFKRQLMDNNEAKYGKEVRKNYGDKTVNQANEKFQNMSPEDYKAFTRLGNEVRTAIAEAFKTCDPSSEIAQRAAALHKEWLAYTWAKYSKEAHAGLAHMYVDDERFKAFYDAEQPGTAEFLRDAILIYTGFASDIVS